MSTVQNWLISKSISSERPLFGNEVGPHFSSFTRRSAYGCPTLDGTSIYLARDIAGAIQRYEKYQFDKMIYVIASAQDLHTAQFFKVLELLEFPWANRLEHVNFGLVHGMSTRRGTVVFLEEIIKEAQSVMHEQMKKNEAKYAAVEDPETVAQETAITGIKVQDMAAKRYVDSSDIPHSTHRLPSLASTTTRLAGIV